MEDHFNQVIEAVNLQLNPSTNANDRKASLSFLSSFEASDSVGNFALLVLSRPDLPKHTNLIRNFAIEQLNRYVKRVWNEASVTEEQKIAMRNEVMKIMNNFLFPIAKEHYSIKHKFVSLLVGIAERTWPQRWETFLPELFQRVNSAGYEIQSEIAMMVICSILEDVTDTDFNTALPSDRRSDILIAMNSSVDAILETVVKLLKSQLSYLHSPEIPDKKGHIMVINSTLKAVSNIFKWVYLEKLRTVSESSERSYFDIFLDGCVDLLRFSEIQDEAIECLLQLSRRNCHERLNDFASLGFAIFTKAINFLPPLMSELSSTLTTITDEDQKKKINDYFFKLSKMITQSATQNFYPMLEDLKNAGQHIPILSSFLQVNLQLTIHSSIIVSFAALEFWEYIFKQETSVKHEVISLITGDVLRVCLEKINVSNDPSLLEALKYRLNQLSDIPDSNAFKAFYLTSCQSSLMSQIEFEMDYSEYNEFYSNSFIQKVSTIFKYASAKYPVKAMEKCCEQWVFMDSTLISSTPLSDDDVSLHSTCVQMQYYDSLTLVVSNTFANIPANYWIKDPSNLDPNVSSILKNSHTLLEKILGSLSSDTHLLERQLRLVGKMHPCFDTLQLEDLGKVLEYLFLQVLSKENAITSTACDCLLKIAKEIPLKLLNYLEWLKGKIKEILTAGVRDVEEVKMYEFLAIITNAMEDSRGRSGFIEQVMFEKVGRWISEDTGNVVSIPENLLAFLGLSKASDTYNPNNLDLLLRPLQAIYDIGKCVDVDNKTAQSPFFQIWGNVIPNVVKMIGSAQNLYKPEIRSHVLHANPSAKGMYSISFLDAVNVASLKINVTVPDNKADQLLSNALPRIIRLGYQVLGLASTHNYSNCKTIPSHSNPPIGGIFAFGEPTLTQMLKLLLENMPYLEPKLLEFVVGKFYVFFTIFCPQTMIKTVLCPFLSNSLHFLKSRLDLEWSSPAESLIPYFLPESLPQEIIDAIPIKNRLAINSAVIEFLQIIQGSKFAGKGYNKYISTDHFASLWSYLFSESELTGVIIRDMLLNYLRWPDSNSCRRAISLIKQSLSNCFKCKELNSWVSRVFSDSLQLLITCPPYANAEDLALEIVVLLKDIFLMQELGQDPGAPLLEDGSCTDSSKTRLDKGPFEIFMKIVSSKDIQSLKQSLIKYTKDKKRKSTFKTFIQDLLIKYDEKNPNSSTILRPKSTNVKNLPDKLQRKKTDAKGGIGDGNLNGTLFDDL